MKHSHGLVVVALLFIGLNVSKGQPVLAIGSLDNQVDEHSPISFPDTFTSEISCSDTFKEQEISDNGSWLLVCFSDPIAPDNGTVTVVNIEYILDHPDPGQLEVILSRENSDIRQVLWEEGELIKGAKFGEVIGLEDFSGTPAQDGWILQIRDIVPGKTGWLRGLTIRPSYAPIGPMPIQISGSPGIPTSFRFPPGILEYTAPDIDESKPGFDETDIVLEETSGWQTIKSEPFEISFPTSGWTLSDGNGGPQYWWDDDNSRAYSGYRAAWPAKGGADALDPPGDPYPPNAESWMKYGPFDLSDAATAEVSFWLWRDTQPYYDRIWIGVSHDNITYTGSYWEGYADWEQITWNLDTFTGDDSVWVGWTFYSNGSDQREGPWVDDAVLRKYVAGQVTARGTLSYINRLNNPTGARYVTGYLYDADSPPGIEEDDYKGTAFTSSSGYFQFPTITNDDDDDPSDPDRHLDLYVVWEADYGDSETSWHRVADLGGQTYTWPSSTQPNAPDGYIDFNLTISASDPAQPAMWIFQDLRRAWEYVHNHTSPQVDPGSIIVKWEDGEECYLLGQWICDGSFFYGTDIGGPFIFIQDSQGVSEDTVVHETGHNYMYNATEWWWWSPACWEHDLFIGIDQNCAWSEGWGDYFALSANGDSCYDYGAGPCGAGGVSYQDLEAINRSNNPPTYPWGDAVEGRVAGAIYDLSDYVTDGYDSAAVGFDPVADIVFQGASEHTFSEFWNSWKTSGLNKHHAVRAIYQNTIDYDTQPRFSPLLPDRNVFQNHPITHAIDLWAYTTDDESADAELTYQITSVTDTRCGISLVDVHWINIVPQTGWLGMCDATVRVNDSLKTASDTFRVTVVPVVASINLPVIMK